MTTKKVQRCGAKGKAAVREWADDFARRRRTLVAGGYQPTEYTAAELATLSEIGMRGGRPRGDVARGEVARVAHNIAAVLSNPATPPEVYDAVSAYALEVCGVALRHFIEYPAAVKALFPVACDVLSAPPFVPSTARVEALTGTDRRRALRAARAGEGGE